MTSQFADLIERAIVTIGEENAALSERRTHGLAEIQARKGIILYELERLGANSPAPARQVLPRLAELRHVLARNRSLLKLNIAAIEEIVAALHELQLGEDSDGTYSAWGPLGAGRG